MESHTQSRLFAAQCQHPRQIKVLIAGWHVGEMEATTKAGSRHGDLCLEEISRSISLLTRSTRHLGSFLVLIFSRVFPGQSAIIARLEGVIPIAQLTRNCRELLCRFSPWSMWLRLDNTKWRIRVDTWRFGMWCLVLALLRVEVQAWFAVEERFDCCKHLKERKQNRKR